MKPLKYQNFTEYEIRVITKQLRCFLLRHKVSYKQFLHYVTISNRDKPPEKVVYDCIGNFSASILMIRIITWRLTPYSAHFWLKLNAEWIDYSKKYVLSDDFKGFKKFYCLT